YAASPVPDPSERPRDRGAATRGIPAPVRATRPDAPGAHDGEAGLSHTAALPVSRRRRRRWPWALLAVLVLVGGAGSGWWFTAGPGATTVVPTVVGRQVDAAQSALSGAALMGVPAEEFSERSGAGVVMRAEPAAGTTLSKDSTVRLVVSKGPERYAVPTLVGTAASALPAALGPLHLTAGETSNAWSETVKEGTVIAQDPKPGATVKRGTTVSVVVSKGRQPLDVPSVVGAGADAAAASITRAGLDPKRADDVNSDTVPVGQVVSQKPSSGTLFRGQTVTITVSKGPVMVTVPGVVGRPVAEAEKALTDLGFTVKTEFPFGRLFDLVRVQSVAEGRSVAKGSTIILTIV
ncbi:MAG: PASTA domain-containing protein, partial [Humibacillus sp.]